MSLIKELLLDKKIMEDKEEIDALLESKGVEDGFVVQSINFDKDIYKDKDQVTDYLSAHLFGEFDIDEYDAMYMVNLFDAAGFVESTMVVVDVREGISVVVGLLKPMSSDNPFFFAEGEGGSIAFSAKIDSSVKLSESLPYIIEVAKVVSGFHPNFGKVEITKNDLISFKNNFDNKVTGIDVSIDFDHEVREAAGWIKELFLSDNGETLLASVRWTPKGALSLNDREFRYFSPEYNRNFVHQHTGKAHGPTLLGGALVNRPFLKMEAIVSLNDKNKKGVPTMETITLADHNAKVGNLEKEIATLKLSENTAKAAIENLKSDNVKLSDELKELKEVAEKKAQEEKFNLLFSEGKINAAQLEALKSGKDMMEVLTLSGKMNNKPNGKTISADSIVLSDDEIKLCKTLGLTQEEYIEANKEA